jgi:hypothetical protein
MSSNELLPGVVDVVAQFDAMLGDDASLQVSDFESGTLRLVYRTADGTVDCEACVLAPDDLEILVLEALQVRSSPVTSVVVDVTEQVSAQRPQEGR